VVEFANQTFALTVNNPQPQINSITPNAIPAGSTSVNMKICGQNFVTNTTASVEGAAIPIQSVSASELTLTLSAAQLSSLGTFPVAVDNPSAGGGISNTINLSVAPSTLQVQSKILMPAQQTSLSQAPFKSSSIKR
jgi:trimeric autotransporter adhesin